jgi:hypothetical protein
MNRSYSDFRKVMYAYHRQGLDLMGQKTEEGRANIANSLRDIQKVFPPQALCLHPANVFRFQIR